MPALIAAAAAATSPDAPILNGGAGRGIPVRTVVEQIFSELRRGEPQFDGSTRAGDPTNYVADVQAATSLGWSPRIPLQEGIAGYVRWFESQR